MTGRRTPLAVLLAVSLLAVALLTLTPTGAGWVWGSPVTELRWYATSLDSGSVMLQLVGNVALLTVPAALAVALWPGLGAPPRLVALALASGTAIKLLQRVLPGRAPLDTAR